MLARIRRYAAGSPFVITSVVVGNVQYPSEVADAVSRKLAATQELERKDTEIEIERKERTKREVQAAGIANAMQIIRGQLNALYIQHEAIEAQKLMVNSPNHTTVVHPGRADGRAADGDVPRPQSVWIRRAAEVSERVSASGRCATRRSRASAHARLARDRARGAAASGR